MHAPRDGHKCLDTCLQMGHATPSLTALTALLPSLLLYAIPTLRPSETPSVWSTGPLQRLAAGDMPTGTWHSQVWDGHRMWSALRPCPGVARLGFGRDVGEGAFWTGLAGGRRPSHGLGWKGTEVAGSFGTEQPLPWRCRRAQQQRSSPEALLGAPCQGSTPCLGGPEADASSTSVPRGRAGASESHLPQTQSPACRAGSPRRSGS